MLRGFTLLEMLVTILAMSTLLLIAAPSFHLFQQKHKIVQLASELQGFLIQAKSEAVFMNQDLWAHIELDSNPSHTGGWTIRLTNSDVDGRGKVIQVFNGAKFTGVAVFSNYVSNQIKFDGVRGKITNGHLKLSLSDEPEKVLNVRSSFGASRIIVCGVGGPLYGYPQCR